MPESVSFGTWLRKRRRSLDLTQKGLADQVGCAEITVRRMEANEYKPSNELALVLLEKLGIPEAERQQWARFARGLAEYPKNQTIPSPAREQITNLPIPLTSFIGRKKDISLIQQRLAGHRLITLLGAGGIGKTRLAQQVASQLLGEYADGVWLVELAALSDPELVPQTVAALFGIQQGTNNRAVVETLVHFLRTKTVLLILDNCEHLLDACAQLVDKLLKNCPDLKILTTSREALGIIGEALYQVRSLTIPELHPIETLEQLNDYESIRLFDERAQLVQMDFALTRENASSVAQICSRLDGIPLAIELAAVRVQTFSAEEIASQLNECFHTLTGGSRTALPRHQTLEASIDWSWHLLYDAEQTVLRRLSIFAGGFTLEAIGQVCSRNGIESRQIVGLISQLVVKSLVVVNQETERERRYRLLETIREYARERLIEAGEEENIHTRYLKYYLGLCKQAEPALRSHELLEWYARMTHERDNIRAALSWAEKTDVEAGLWIAGSLWRFWEDVDLREGERWLKKFLGMPESRNHPAARAKALYAYGILLFLTEQYAALEKTAEECLGLYRTLGDPRGEIDGLIVSARRHSATNDPIGMQLLQKAFALAKSVGDIWRQAFALGHIGWASGDDYQQQISNFKAAISLFREAGDFRELQEYLGTLGNCELMSGDIESAQEHLAEAMQLSQNPYFKGAMHYLPALGRVEAVKGNFEKARALLERSITNAIELGNRNHYLWNRAQFGHILIQQGKSGETREIFVETAQEFLKDGNIVGVCYALEGMTALFVETGRSVMAARLIGWADAMREQIKDTRPILEQTAIDKIVAACVVEMGQAAFSDAYQEGRGLSLDEAVAHSFHSEF